MTGVLVSGFGCFTIFSDVNFLYHVLVFLKKQKSRWEKRPAGLTLSESEVLDTCDAMQLEAKPFRQKESI